MWVGVLCFDLSFFVPLGVVVSGFCFFERGVGDMGIPWKNMLMCFSWQLSTNSSSVWNWIGDTDMQKYICEAVSVSR